MTCQGDVSKGVGTDSGRRRIMCTNHPNTPCDTTCKQCKKPHCSACLNGASKCFRCAMSAGRTPTGSLKSPGGTSKLSMPASKNPLANLSPQALAGAAVAVLLLSGAGYFATHRGGHATGGEEDTAYLGKAAIAILSPREGRVLSGNQTFKLDITSPKQVQKVTITIDGKYWDTWEKDPDDANGWLHEHKPPFTSDWPTGIFSNGSHGVIAAVTYRGGRRQAVDQRHYKTQNAGFK